MPEYKSTDEHQCLYFDSCHVGHTETSIVYSQALRWKEYDPGEAILLLI